MHFFIHVTVHADETMGMIDAVLVRDQVYVYLGASVSCVRVRVRVCE
jgi:hypothetical protein